MLTHASRLCEIALRAPKMHSQLVIVKALKGLNNPFGAPFVRPKCIRILSATRTPHRKLSADFLLYQLHCRSTGVLFASSHADACLSSLRDRPAGAQNAFAIGDC